MQSATSQGTPFQEIWDYITGITVTQDAENQALRGEITALKAEAQALRDELDSLSERVASLESGAPPPPPGPQSMTVYLDGEPMTPNGIYPTTEGDHVFTVQFANPEDGAWISWTLTSFSHGVTTGEGYSFTSTIARDNHALKVEAYLQDGTYYDYLFYIGAY